MIKGDSFPKGPYFLKAFEYSMRQHGEQKRKGSLTPYICHPMIVAGMVLERCGTEEQAIVALLHDVLEDCEVTPEDLRREFGPEVEKLVLECSDTLSRPKPPWFERKRKFIASVRSIDKRTLLVLACDKLHNSTAVVRELQCYGQEEWKKFQGTPEQICQFYNDVHYELSLRVAEGGEPLKHTLGELKLAILEMENFRDQYAIEKK